MALLDRLVNAVPKISLKVLDGLGQHGLPALMIFFPKVGAQVMLIQVRQHLVLIFDD